MLASPVPLPQVAMVAPAARAFLGSPDVQLSGTWQPMAYLQLFRCQISDLDFGFFSTIWGCNRLGGGGREGEDVIIRQFFRPTHRLVRHPKVEVLRAAGIPKKGSAGGFLGPRRRDGSALAIPDPDLTRNPCFCFTTSYLHTLRS